MDAVHFLQPNGMYLLGSQVSGSKPAQAFGIKGFAVVELPYAIVTGGQRGLGFNCLNQALVSRLHRLQQGLARFGQQTRALFRRDIQCLNFAVEVCPQRGIAAFFREGHALNHVACRLNNGRILPVGEQQILFGTDGHLRDHFIEPAGNIVQAADVGLGIGKVSHTVDVHQPARRLGVGASVLVNHKLVVTEAVCIDAPLQIQFVEVVGELLRRRQRCAVKLIQLLQTGLVDGQGFIEKGFGYRIPLIVVGLDATIAGGIGQACHIHRIVFLQVGAKRRCCRRLRHGILNSADNLGSFRCRRGRRRFITRAGHQQRGKRHG